MEDTSLPSPPCVDEGGPAKLRPMAVPVVRPHSHRRRPRPDKDRPDLSCVPFTEKPPDVPHTSKTLQHFIPHHLDIFPSNSQRSLRHQRSSSSSGFVLTSQRLESKEPLPHLLQTSAIPTTETHPHPPILSPANRPTQRAWRSRSRLQNTG